MNRRLAAALVFVISFLPIIVGVSPASELPLNVQIQQYMLELELAVGNDDHKTAVSVLEKLLQERERVNLPPDLLYHYARSLHKIGRYREAYDTLVEYLNIPDIAPDSLDAAIRLKMDENMVAVEKQIAAEKRAVEREIAEKALAEEWLREEVIRRETEQRRLNEARNEYNKLMLKGKEKMAAGDWSGAEEEFLAALSVPGYRNDGVAKEAIAAAQTAPNRRAFDLAVRLGDEKLRNEDWIAAETAFLAALAIPGFTENTKALNGLSIAKGGAPLKLYQTAMALGDRSLSVDDWAGAEAAYLSALQAKGFENDANALEGLAVARGGMPLKMYRTAMALGDECLAAEDWSGSEKAYLAALEAEGFQNDAKAKEGLESARGGPNLKAYRLSMAEGRSRLEQKEWVKAERAYSAALEVPGREEDPSALEGLEKARREGADALYRSEMAEGESYLRQRDWARAEQAFSAVLKARGYEYDQAATDGLEKSKNGGARARHDDAMVEAEEFAVRRNWNSAKSAFMRGLMAVNRSDDQSVEWLRWAADRGHGESQYDLGEKYFAGEGVPLDYTEALRLYHMAANQGHAKAMNDIGHMYFQALGVPHDCDEALRWFRRAAAKGNTTAVNNVNVVLRHKSRY